MTKKIKIILLMLTLTVCMGFMSTTYSRYVASAKSDINAQFSKWQILVNNFDITNRKESSVDITPVIEDNTHVASNTFAPTSKGYFDIEINPTNVDVSFLYNIDLNIDNESMPDILINKYAILPDNYVEGDNLDLTIIEDGSITNTLLYDNNAESFTFNTFTIRIFFEWYEGEGEFMDDEADTNLAMLALSNETSVKMSANIRFEQVIN